MASRPALRARIANASIGPPHGRPRALGRVRVAPTTLRCGRYRRRTRSAAVRTGFRCPQGRWRCWTRRGDCGAAAVGGRRSGPSPPAGGLATRRGAPLAADTPGEPITLHTCNYGVFTWKFYGKYARPCGKLGGAFCRPDRRPPAAAARGLRRSGVCRNPRGDGDSTGSGSAAQRSENGTCGHRRRTPHSAGKRLKINSLRYTAPQGRSII